MKRKGCFHLRMASLLVILLGAGSIVAVRLLLGASGTGEGFSESELREGLAGIAGLYAVNGFKILAGLIGLALANKRSKLTVALGFLLFVAQLTAFLQIGNGIGEILIHILLLVIPYYYFHSALKNYRDQTQR